MNKETTRIARKRADRTVIVRNVSTAHRRTIEKMMMEHTEDLSNITNLTNSDGTQQYIHGVSPLDATVRVGNAS